MKKFLVLFLALLMVPFAFIHVRAADVELGAGGTWTYQFFDKAAGGGGDLREVCVFTYEVKIPAGSTEFYFNGYSLTEQYADGLDWQYSYWDGSAVTPQIYGAYWIDYATSDDIGNYEITNDGERATYLETINGVENWLVFEYDDLVTLGWDEDYTFVVRFGLDFSDMSFTVRNYTARFLQTRFSALSNIYYVIDESLGYYTLQFLNANQSVIYYQTYAPGVFEFNPDNLPSDPVPPSVHLSTEYYQFLAWKYYDGTVFDPDAVDTSKAVDNVIKVYSTWIAVPIDSSDADIPDTTPVETASWISTLMASWGGDNTGGYMILFVAISAAIATGITMLPFKKDLGIYIIPELLWLGIATWLGIVPLFVTAILGMIEFTLLLTTFNSNKGGVDV